MKELCDLMSMYFFFFRMSDNLTKKEWKEFLFLCCPLCDFKVKTKDEFTRHTLNEHYDWAFEECDSTIHTFETKDFHKEIVPEGANYAGKFQWAMSDDIKISFDDSKISEESTQLLFEEPKVHIMTSVT